MKRFTAVFTLFLAVTVVVWAQEADQPLKRAKVGDYVIFKMEGPVKGTMKQEVTAVSEKEVTVKTITTINGMELKPSEQTIDLTKKADPSVEEKNKKKFRIVETGKGQETLRIGGKDYKCDWRSMTTTVTQNGMDIVTEAKVWISKDAPVYGMVKTENKTFGMLTVTELIEAGKKK